jgi:hypothetical protein
MALVACKKKTEETKPADAPPPAADTKPATPPPAEPPAAAPAAAAPAGSTGIPECDDYIKTMDKYAKCDKLPAEAKKAMLDGFEQGKQAWAAVANAPAEAKTQMASGCKAGNDAAVQALTQLGCN